MRKEKGWAVKSKQSPLSKWLDKFFVPPEEAYKAWGRGIAIDLFVRSTIGIDRLDRK